MIGRNYENLIKQGLLSEAEAKPLIRTAYTELLQEYPNCKAVTAAQNWLNRN